MRIQRDLPKTSNMPFVISLILVAIIGRVMPHPPNVTPFLSILVFASVVLEFTAVLLTLVMAYLVSNISLGVTQGFAWFGWWTVVNLFAYFFLAMVINGSYSKGGARRYVSLVGVCSLVFWLWSNLGVWVYSGMYEYSLRGLLQCYTLALPFLKNALMGDLFWASMLVFGYLLSACSNDCKLKPKITVT